MPKVHKKRKLPVTVVDHRQPLATTSTASSSRPATTRTVIRRFHVLIKRKAQLEKAISRGEASVDGLDSNTALKQVEREIEGLGGLGAYQRMSSIGQGSDRGGGSERVLIEWLKELGVHRSAKETRKRLQYVHTCARPVCSNPTPSPFGIDFWRWGHYFRITTRRARAGSTTRRLTCVRGTLPSGNRTSCSWTRRETARSGMSSVSASSSISYPRRGIEVV